MGAYAGWLECGVDIEIFSDVVCPWCWIGERKLMQAVDGFTADTGEPVNVR
ncbi:MAG: hypothetical protein HOV67_12835, partial [Kribbellaceae bacterium]|nr:hypothetical protein [Kribbellaceae bacterium]